MNRRQCLPEVILLTLLTGAAFADVRESGPPFSARTLGGETVTSGSLRGKVVLVQFWATWCPVCKRDQASLDKVTRDFARKGLVVLAVDVDESGETVKKYLAEHPRSCDVVLTENTNLVAAYSPSGFPYYVLIDREGKIAGTQDGGGGEESLLYLLRKAGLGGARGGFEDNGQSNIPTPAIVSSPKLIYAPRGAVTRKSKPAPPAIFILKTGEKFEARHYTIMMGTLHATWEGSERTVPLDDLDLKATIAANHARGVSLKIPAHQNEISLGF